MTDVRQRKRKREHECQATPVQLGTYSDGARWCPHCGAIERKRTEGTQYGWRYWTFPGGPKNPGVGT